MKRLYVMRHGVAVPGGEGGFSDADRPLTPRGERKAAEIAQGLAAIGVELDRIVSSPLPRARRTAEIVASTLNIDDRLGFHEVLVTGATAYDLWQWATLQSFEKLMVVGHEPQLSRLIARIIGQSEGEPSLLLKKGGVAAFEADESGRLLLVWLATPKLLRSLG